ncbi:hypothetical protein MNBD_PLANCTO02-1929 [hydrothermal vent metagenome]|uniref:3-keto-alpha-glucoside-1,2-lyase/3-keto-2-hydroxy-glucal hydratase domain-containing protein n=1 Tax=hydrothermal vent metagenome TaxID=652676 RepID=A0A3B1E5E2_9ZZZZ
MKTQKNRFAFLLAFLLLLSFSAIKPTHCPAQGAAFQTLKRAQALADGQKTNGKWVNLFDGKTLNGWTKRGGKADYKVENGTIVGTTIEGSSNTFLCTKDYSDFELQFDVLCDVKLNSGCQIRSHVYKKETPHPTKPKRKFRKGHVYGYQCEIAHNGTAGNFWDEARRTRWLAKIDAKAKKAYKNNQWNHYRIVAKGDHIQSWVNDIKIADFHDKTDASGFIGLQVHAIKKGTGPYSVRWKNVKIKELK